MNKEEMSARQEAAFAELKEDFSRLQQQEMNARKALGLSDNDSPKLDEADLTPEVRKALEEAKAKAQREGAARAAQYEAASAEGPRASVPGGRRQGVMRI